MVNKLAASWYLTLRNRHFVSNFEKQTLCVRLFNKKITTFDMGTEQIFEFQNLFEITVKIA